MDKEEGDPVHGSPRLLRTRQRCLQRSKVRGRGRGSDRGQVGATESAPLGAGRAPVQTYTYIKYVFVGDDVNCLGLPPQIWRVHCGRAPVQPPIPPYLILPLQYTRVLLLGWDLA
ncbi:hypothetical protein QAD02_003756 [Eretmocerus hayati]|uniref:Uncharacterized protein n=1 Tax=Eretmocerus hayati TaxID=131215 RepID=A0ACC2NN13_9HYME|nr:hypothetical protein QAD02_003756 [Eretmocerus hayati]